MSDTPRTDANTIRIEFCDGPFNSLVYVPVEFSQTLERELAAVKAERDNLMAQRESFAETLEAVLPALESASGLRREHFPAMGSSLTANETAALWMARAINEKPL